MWRVIKTSGASRRLNHRLRQLELHKSQGQQQNPEQGGRALTSEGNEKSNSSWLIRRDLHLPRDSWLLIGEGDPLAQGSEKSQWYGLAQKFCIYQWL